MNEQKGKLEVVDENDNVIGFETREKIHKEGLLHREIHVFFITPNKEIIFQHRAKDKDTYPDKLDATIGGHVEPGDSYEYTAIKECKEETGVDIEKNNLFLLKKFKRKSFDESTGKRNNTIRVQYAYFYKRTINDLQIEVGKSEGFEAWKIDELNNLSEEKKNRFIKLFLSKEMIELYKEAYNHFVNN